MLFDASLVLDAYGRTEDVAIVESEQEESGSQAGRKESIEVDRHSHDKPKEASGFTIKRIKFDEAEVNRRAIFLGLNQARLQLLPPLALNASQVMPQVLDEFYSLIRGTPILADLVSADQVDRLMNQVAKYWHDLLQGQIDPIYAASRMRIGVVHEQIGLLPQWYLAGLARQVTGLLSSFAVENEGTPAAIDAFLRVVFFDVTYVIDAYMDARANRLLQIRGFAPQLIRRLDSALAIVDRKYRIIFANEPFVSMAGIDPGLLYCMDIEHAVPVAGLKQLTDDVFNQHKERVSTIQKVGDRTFRLTLSFLECSDDKNEQRAAVVLDDVSDVIRTAESIENTAQHLNRLASVVAAVLWEMDWESRTLLSISQGSSDLLDHRDLFLLGRPYAWSNAIVPEDLELFDAACESLRTLKHTTCEYRLVTPDGRVVYVSSHLSRIPTNSVSLRIAAVTTDITRRSRIDELRLKSLEGFASRMCGVTSVAMSAVLTNLEQLKRDHPIDERLPTSLNQASNEVKRVTSVLSSLSTFSGRRPLQVRVSDINVVLNSMFPELRILAGDELDLDLQTDSNLPTCWLDPDEFLLIVAQLIDNSRQATTGRGRASVKASYREHGETRSTALQEKQAWVEVSVSDDGIGMPEEVRRRAIEPFYTAFRRGNNYGLGLSMVHGYVTQCGGYLTIRSVESHGTTVTMHFPRSNGDTRPSRVANQMVASKKLLVVDSDERELQWTAQVAENLGYTVRAAISLSESHHFASKELIDVLITDARLSGLADGFGLSNMVTALNPDAVTILMTDSQSVAMAHQVETGQALMILKPFSPAELSSSLQQALARKEKRLDELVRLSVREREVLQFIASGLSQTEVGQALGISGRTVEQHVRSARQKLNAVNTIDTVVQAIGNREIVP